MNSDMSTDPDQIRAQIAELLADVPDPAQEGSNLDQLAESDIDSIAARLEEAARKRATSRKYQKPGVVAR